MDNNLFGRIKEALDANSNIGVIVAPNPSFDEMAAGLGLYLALKQMGKNTSIVCATDVTVGNSSLVGIDKVQKSFGGSNGDFVVSFPNRDGEIGKVRYTTDNGKLNIILEPGPNGINFGQSDITYQQAGTGVAPSLVICLGVANLQEAGLSQGQGTKIINIDNKPDNTKFGDIIHVDTKFSSVSEEVADFLTLLEPQIELDVDTSQNLLSGILSATNDFENGHGSYLAFEMTGILMKKGAVRSANGPFANPTTPSMPTQNYFPQENPVQPVQSVQQVQSQPVQQPQQVFQPNVPTPNFGNIFQPNAQPVQPAQQVYQNQPIQPVQNPEPAPVQSNQNSQPPADWLTPKVYKGSTVL